MSREDLIAIIEESKRVGNAPIVTRMLSQERVIHILKDAILPFVNNPDITTVHPRVLSYWQMDLKKALKESSDRRPVTVE